MFGYSEHGCRGGSGMHEGEGFGHGFGLFFEEEDFPASKGLQVEFLKRKRDHLELRKKDIDAEIKYIDEKIGSLEK